jgi:hypothetical protein
MAPHTRRFGVGWSGPVLLAGLAALTSGQPLGAIAAQGSKAPVVNSLRMYVFDLGNIPVDQGDAGQQVLVVNLPKMGRVMLSGDLYHFREEREQRVLPHSLEHDRKKSRQSRVRLEAWGDAEPRAHLDRARHTLVCDAEEGSRLPRVEELSSLG